MYFQYMKAFQYFIREFHSPKMSCYNRLWKLMLPISLGLSLIINTFHVENSWYFINDCGTYGTRHMLSTELAVTIGCSIVASHLNYCNSLLYGAPSTSLDKLQRCQNMLVRVVTQSSSRTSAKPLLQSLHWLPIRERIRHTKSPPWRSRLIGCHHRRT